MPYLITGQFAVMAYDQYVFVLQTLLVPDRWYFYSNTATENITTVKVKKTIDYSWEEIRNVNMNTSHTETFISTDIDDPMIPQNLIIESFPDFDAILLDWDPNTDGAVNVLDMIMVGQHWDETGSTGWIREDVNEDGTISVLDMILIGQHWTG